LKNVFKVASGSPAILAIVFSIIVGVFLFNSIEAANVKKTYTIKEMPQVMSATWDYKVINDDTEKQAILSLLERGQLIVINEHTQKTKWLITAGILINARPETLFSVICDMDNYQKFMPMTEGAKAIDRGPNIIELNLTLKLKIVKGIPAIPMNYSVLHYHRPPYRSDWTYYSGKFESNDGFYQFVPVDDGNSTMAFYTIYSRPRIPIATNLFEKDPNLELVMNMSTAVMVTRALKKRAEEVEKREPFVPGKGMTGTAVDAMTKDPKTVKLLLSRGGLILIEDGKRMWATTAVSMDAPQGEVFELITRYEKYPCYMSQVKKTEVLKRSPKGARAAFKLSLDYAILRIPLKYELSYLFNPPTDITWKWAAGDIPDQEGSWKFLPVEGSKKTLGFLRMTMDLRTLPGMAGAGLKASIGGQPSLEPALMGSQTLINARSTRDFLRLSPAQRKKKIDECLANK